MKKSDRGQKRMMRVLIIATSRYTRGGISAVIKAHATGEQWKRHRCKWIGYHIDRSHILKVLFAVQALARFIILLPFYQIVHLHFSLATDMKRAYIFFRIARMFEKKIIAHLHCGDQLPEIWGNRYVDVFTHSDVGLVLSPSIKKGIEEHIGTGYDIRVLYNPCPSVSTITPFKERMKIILFAGTLNSNKGYADLISSFSMIAAKHPDWQLVFAGNGEVEQAKELATANAISEQCRFLGWVSGEEKDIAFRSASLLCLPSYAEGFPMAVLDAWAYGLPVVATPAGGLADIIQDGINGLLFPAGDIEKLAMQLDCIISNDALRLHIAKESSQLALTMFNIDTINRQLGGIYEELGNN